MVCRFLLLLAFLKIAIGDRYIRALESGEKRNPSAVLLFRVSIVLEVPMEELMESEKEAL